MSDYTLTKTGTRRVASRPLYEIARDIRRDWKPVNFAAKPYLEAMETLDSIRDNYGYDSGTSIVAYFLSNASSWRGPVAKEIKKELNQMLKRKANISTHQIEAKFPPKAMDFNKVDDADAFWGADVEKLSRAAALRPLKSPKEVGDVIFWLNMAASAWEDFPKVREMAASVRGVVSRRKKSSVDGGISTLALALSRALVSGKRVNPGDAMEDLKEDISQVLESMPTSKREMLENELSLGLRDVIDECFNRYGVKVSQPADQTIEQQQV